MKALKSLFNPSNYKTSIDFFEEISNNPDTDTSSSAKAHGFIYSLQSFEFFVILKIIIEIFEDVEILNTELQSKNLCIHEPHEIVKATVEKLKNARKEKFFDSLWENAIKDAKSVGVDEPKLKRKRNIPKKLDSNPNHLSSN